MHTLMLKKLRRNTHIAITAIVLFLVFDFAALALNFWLSSKIEQQAVSINLAGRQRMLSQRMTKALLQLEHAHAKQSDITEHLRELDLTQELFHTTLLGFENGHGTLGGDNQPIFLPPVAESNAQRLVKQAQRIWTPYHLHIHQVLAADADNFDATLQPALGYAAAHNLQLLDLMNQLTTELEQMTQKEAGQIRLFQGGAFVLALLNFFGAILLYLQRMRVMSRSHGLLDNIIDKVQTGVLVIGPEQQIMKANRMAEHLFGRSAATMRGHRLGELLRDQYGELHGVRADGNHFLAESESSQVLMDDIAVTIVTIKDITQQRKNEAQLAELAYHDPLTHLPNRLLFEDRLRQEIARAHRGSYQLGILFLDLDRFKPINDTYGHAMGDKVLQAVATRLREQLREVDTVARRGGDEFTIVITELHGTDAVEHLAENILERMVAPFEIDGLLLQLGASIGISLYPAHGTDPATLIKHADEAMYQAKQAGRNTWRHYQPGEQPSSESSQT